MPANPSAELSSINFGAMIGGPLVAVIEAQTLAARATADFIKTVGFNEDNEPVYVSFRYPKEVAPYKPIQVIATIINPGSGYDTAPEVTLTPAGDWRAEAFVTNGTVVGVQLVGSGTPPTTITIDAPPAGASTQATASLSVVPAQDAIYQTMQIEVPILTILPIPFIRVEEASIDFNAKINSIETSSESSDLAISGSLEVKQRWPSGSAKLNVACSYQRKSASGSSIERTYSMHIFVKASQDEMPAGMERMLGLLESAMKATPVT